MARAPSSELPHDTIATPMIASSAQNAITRDKPLTEVMDIVRFVMPALDDLRVKLSSSARHSCMSCHRR